jgi:hypothetical protein
MHAKAEAQPIIEVSSLFLRFESQDEVRELHKWMHETAIAESTGPTDNYSLKKQLAIAIRGALERTGAV